MKPEHLEVEARNIARQLSHHPHAAIAQMINERQRRKRNKLTATDIPALLQNRLRPIAAVACSTIHLSRSEVERIEEELYFDAEKDEMLERPLETIVHDGLHITSKPCGFYARVPSDAVRETVLEQLSPEMRAIVEAAIDQDAVLIEFDVDEDPSDHLTTFDP